MPTIRDVAKLAGAAPITVSRAINTDATNPYFTTIASRPTRWAAGR